MSEVGLLAAGRPIVNIEQYKSLVDDCARHRRDFDIPNGSPAHARVLISKLFETAQQSVSIVSGQLIDTTRDTNEEVYGFGELIARAKEFLRRSNSSLTIILEEPVHLGVGNRFLRSVVEDPERKGNVVVYPETKAVNSTSTPHITVTDALAFRMELDNDKVEAFANFGDAEYAKTVSSLFEKLELFVVRSGARRFLFKPGEKLVLS